MADGAPIYFDPYEKTNLKGQAMLIARIADTAEATHHGVTCQRWLVQFEEGQLHEAHWLDPNDVTAWDLPFIGTAIVTFSRLSFTFSDIVLYAYVKYGECPMLLSAALRYAGYLAPYPGRIRRVSFHTHCAGVVGTPLQLTLRPLLNGANIAIIDVDDYDNNAVYNYQLSDDWDDITFAQGDNISMQFRCKCAEGESLSINYFTASLHLQFGPSY